MKNTLTDLNNHLFAQLERLGDEELTDEQLRKEVDRAKSINEVAKNIIDNAKTTLEGAKLMYEHLPANSRIPEQFRIKEEK